MKLSALHLPPLEESPFKHEVLHADGTPSGGYLYLTTTMTKDFQDAVFSKMNSSVSPASSAEIVATLVCGWSFEDEFSRDEVISLLRKNPPLCIRCFTDACEHTAKLVSKKNTSSKQSENRRSSVKKSENQASQEQKHLENGSK